MSSLSTDVCDLMCDFETLGTSADSVILSFGLCLFNRETGDILDAVYQEFDIRQQISDGLIVSPETVSWWRKENPDELHRLLYSNSNVYPSGYLPYLFHGLKGSYKYIWSRGCMDAHILQHHAEGIPYWIFKDLRTLDIFGIPMQKNNHNALEDCKNQIKYLCEVIRRCNVRTAEETLMKSMESVRTVGAIGIPT